MDTEGHTCLNLLSARLPKQERSADPRNGALIQIRANSAIALHRLIPTTWITQTKDSQDHE